MLSLKKFLILCIAFLCLPLSTLFSADGQWGFHKQDVVVEVAHFSQSKHISVIQNALLEVSANSKVVLVCPDKGWLIIELDLDQIANEMQLESILKPTGLGVLIKSGATRKEVMRACGGDIIKL